MRAWIVGALVALTYAGPAGAALVTVTGGTAYTLPGAGGTKAYDNLTGAAVVDPWTAGTEVLRGATISFGPHATNVIVTFLGREANYANTFETWGSPLFRNTTSKPGDTLTLTIAEFLGSVFRSQGKGAGFGTASDRVAITFAENTLQLGFNDSWAGDADFDDMRLSALVTPVPAALPLLGSAVLGLWGYRRWKRHVA